MKTPRAFLLAATLCISGVLRAAEPSGAPLLRIEAGMHTAIIKRVAVDEAGRMVLTASSDKTARLWELPSGRLLRVLRPPIGDGVDGQVFACALSPDGSLAAVGGYLVDQPDKIHNILLFQTATGRLVRRISCPPASINQLSFSAQGRFLAAVISGGPGLRVWDTATGAEIGSDADYGGEDGNSVDWHREDRIVTTGDDGFLRLYQFQTASRPGSSKKPGSAAGAAAGKLTRVLKAGIPGGKKPFDARFAPDGRAIAVGFLDVAGIAVVDPTDFHVLFLPDTTGVSNGNLSNVSWSRDGKSLAACGVWAKQFDGVVSTVIRVWKDGGKGAARDVPTIGNTLADLQSIPGGSFIFCGGGPTWGVVASTGERTFMSTTPLADVRGLYEQFRLSGDGMTVAFAYEILGKAPARFSIAARELSIEGARKTPGAPLAPPKMTGLPVTGWQNSRDVKVAENSVILKRGEMSRSLAIARDASGFLLGSEWYLSSFTAKGDKRWRREAPGVAWAVNLVDKDRLAVAAYGDGTIRWHRAETGEELLALFPHADRQRWILWTPQGYYDCAPGAEDLIGWHVNRGKDKEADFFPAAKFREQFYRPDVIQKVLPLGDVAAAVKAADEAAGRKIQAALRIEDVVSKMQPPVVELAVGGARGEVTAPAGAATMTVRYRVRRGGGEPVTRVRFLLDGRPAGKDAAVPASDTAEASAEVPLPARDCIVAVLAENRFAVSEPATLRIVRGGAGPGQPPAALKPKLYLLAAGITDYLNNDQLDDLHFAAKDATDFTAALRRQEGGLYQKVEAKVLTNKDATAASIREGLDWIRQETTARDVAVIFLSGHGENDERQRYFFCAQDYDKKRRTSTGVSFEEIQRNVQAIPGKVLFFIDSCHAGNALGKLYAAKGAGAQLDVTRMVNELSDAENGAIVFTSSTGQQLSLELTKENNGAFTKAIVEGLDGGADLLRSGKITVASLEAFVAERVKALTEGQQTPTVAKPQTVPDFPIAVKR